MVMVYENHVFQTICKVRQYLLQVRKEGCVNDCYSPDIDLESIAPPPPNFKSENHCRKKACVSLLNLRVGFEVVTSDESSAVFSEEQNAAESKRYDGICFQWEGGRNVSSGPESNGRTWKKDQGPRWPSLKTWQPSNIRSKEGTALSHLRMQKEDERRRFHVFIVLVFPKSDSLSLSIYICTAWILVVWSWREDIIKQEGVGWIHGGKNV